MDNIKPRRVFLHTALTTVGITACAGTVAALLNACETNESNPVDPVAGIDVKVSDLEDLTGPGTIAQTIIPGVNSDAPVFVSQVGATTYLVFSSTCTHQACPVDLPSTAGGDLECNLACGHGSRFSSVDGSVKTGPAASRLKSFSAAFNSSTGILTVQP